MSAVSQLLVNLALSILIEGALAYALLRSWRFVYVTLLCNLLTNPVVNLLTFAALRFLPGLYWVALIALELAAVLVEARVYTLLYGMANRRALFLSLLINAVSYGAGAVFWRMLA